MGTSTLSPRMRSLSLLQLFLWIVFFFFLHLKQRGSSHSVKSDSAIPDHMTNTSAIEYDTLYSHNYCVKHRIPWVASLLETAQYLSFTNKSLVRFGDADINLMDGRAWNQYEPYDPDLAERLLDIFTNPTPNLEIGLPDIFDGFPKTREVDAKYWNKNKRYKHWLDSRVRFDKQYFNTHITSPFVTTYGTYCELIPTIYEYLRNVWLDKDVVILRGQNNQEYTYDVYDTARSQTILYAAGTRAWKQYEFYRDLLMKQDPSKLFIVTIGATAKVLVHDLTKAGRRALDLGHLAKDYNVYKTGGSIKMFYLDPV